MLNRKQCRAADANAIDRYRIPSLVLMENAGRNCVDKILWHSRFQTVDEQTIVVLCGPGNNGGDGFVIARHLYNEGAKVKVVLFQSMEKYRGDARLNLDAISRLRMTVTEFGEGWPDEKVKSVIAKVGRRNATWIVDAMLGTGALGEPRPSMATSIQVANSMDARRFAVDIPTGLDCDTGEPSNATFRANITCTFIDSKIGFQNPIAQSSLGQVYVVGIGAPSEIVRTS